MSFFFQAEDGIRDLYVTGVQTCALPIYDPARCRTDLRRERGEPLPRGHVRERRQGGPVLQGLQRSEERRVGKEGRSGWAWNHGRKKGAGLCEGLCAVQLDEFARPQSVVR